MAARHIMEGTRVRIRGVRREHPDYDEGIVQAREGDAAIVRWSVAAASYTEAVRELVLVRKGH